MKQYAALVLALVAGASNAAGLKYDSLEMQWDKLDTDQSFASGYAGVTAPGEQLDAFGLKYQNRLKDNWIVSANYWSADGDGVVLQQGFSSDAKKVNAGGGYIFQTSDDTALDVQAHIGRFRYSRSNVAEMRSNFVEATATYRWQVIPRLEFSGAVVATEFNDSRFADEYGYKLGVDYRFSGSMFVGATYNQYQDSNSTSIRLRVLW